MATWPNIASPTFGTVWKIYNPRVETEMDGGYFQTRKRFTRAIYFLDQKWNAMTHADLLLLQAFFETNQGDDFDFTHPITGNADVCNFMTDEIDATPIDRTSGGLVYQVSCPIRKK